MSELVQHTEINPFRRIPDSFLDSTSEETNSDGPAHRVIPMPIATTYVEGMHAHLMLVARLQV
jgi:hypothetical protein